MRTLREVHETVLGRLVHFVGDVETASEMDEDVISELTIHLHTTDTPVPEGPALHQMYSFGVHLARLVDEHERKAARV